MGYKKHHGGGGAPVAPPLDPPLSISFYFSAYVTTFLPLIFPGVDPGFSWGGGGRKRCYARTHITRNQKSLSAGVLGPLKGPGSFRGFVCSLALSRLILKHSDKKWKNKTVDQISGGGGGGGGAPVAPIWIQH